MKRDFKVAIIIPAYNESNNILKLIEKINYYLKSTIVIIDDSNNNFTKNILSKKKTKNIIYIKRNKKLGRGSAVIEGFKKIFYKKQFKYFVEMDADLSHDPKELKKNLISLHEKKVDLLICSRYLRKSLIINWPLKRRIFSRLSNYLIRALFKLDINDCTNGFRFYSRRSVKSLLEKRYINQDFIMLTEIILFLSEKNYKILEVESIFNNRTKGSSTINMKLILNSLYSIIKLFIIKKFSEKLFSL
jgi:dolichol-phosphate mannosyltransferase